MISFSRLGEFGRVGNQLFQYTYLRSQANRMGVTYACPEWWGDWVFDLQETNRVVSAEPCRHLFREPALHCGFNASALAIQDDTDVCGYFQTEKYFQPDARSWFRFKQSGFRPELAGTTSLHFRFGDYLTIPHVYPQLTDAYLVEAMKRLEVNALSVFSDDPALARERLVRLGIRNFTLFEGNSEEEDLLAMASCGSHILSNSSFSWWGAFLSFRPDAPVLVPDPWFHPGHPIQNPDIMAKGWQPVPMKLGKEAFRYPTVTAVVAGRNGAAYLPELFSHLRENGLRVIYIDNDSTDQTAQILEAHQDLVDDVIHLPYHGYFDLSEQLQVKQKVIDGIREGWVIHHDVDEFFYSDVFQEPLATALARVDAQGYTAVNFDEFVFLPLQHFWERKPEGFRSFEHYYYFDPSPLRLQRAFKAGQGIQLVGGGHALSGEIRLYPKNMMLRHTPFENRRHLRRKYMDRNYAPGDIGKFHGNRLKLQGRRLNLPNRDLLKVCVEDQWHLDRSDPKPSHFWEWE